MTGKCIHSRFDEITGDDSDKQNQVLRLAKKPSDQIGNSETEEEAS